jgi:hypothetical protein
VFTPKTQLILQIKAGISSSDSSLRNPLKPVLPCLIQYVKRFGDYFHAALKLVAAVIHDMTPV